ncbi:hypothetical protein F2P79_022103, partial [Pimephales promelas]
IPVRRGITIENTTSASTFQRLDKSLEAEMAGLRPVKSLLFHRTTGKAYPINGRKGCCGSQILPEG